MTSKIESIASRYQLPGLIGNDFNRTQPLSGLTNRTGSYLKPKTVALLMIHNWGGARVFLTGNLNTTQPESVAYPIAPSVEAIGEPTQDDRVRNKPIDNILDTMPDLIIDNEGDIFSRWLARPFAQLRGGTEETTSGRIRLALIRVRLIMPILVINDSPIKQLAENRHAVGQSTIESFLRKTNLAPNGRRVVIFGYGGVARGWRLASSEPTLTSMSLKSTRPSGSRQCVTYSCSKSRVPHWTRLILMPL